MFFCLDPDPAPDWEKIPGSGSVKNESGSATLALCDYVLLLFILGGPGQCSHQSSYQSQKADRHQTSSHREACLLIFIRLFYETATSDLLLSNFHNFEQK